MEFHPLDILPSVWFAFAVAAEIRLPSWNRVRETQIPQEIEGGANEAG
jgi:hypothetical protein